MPTAVLSMFGNTPFSVPLSPQPLLLLIPLAPPVSGEYEHFCALEAAIYSGNLCQKPGGGVVRLGF